MYLDSPYICCPCRLNDPLNVVRGYKANELSTLSCSRVSHWPCMKLNTVTSVALGMEVLAAGSLSSADQCAPSLVFEPKRMGTWANNPALNASTGRVVMNVLSKLGAKTKRVSGRALSSFEPANVRVALLAERRHPKTPVVLHPL